MNLLGNHLIGNDLYGTFKSSLWSDLADSVSYPFWSFLRRSLRDFFWHSFGNNIQNIEDELNSFGKRKQ